MQQGNEPLTVKVMIEGKPVVMEIDTGANSSIMPLKYFKSKFPNVTLSPITLFGQSSTSVYKGLVNVSVGEINVMLSLKVTDYGNTVCLLGREWLNVVMPNWKKNLLEVKDDKVCVNHMFSKEQRDQLTEKLQSDYPTSINKSGGINGFSVNIKIKEGITPKFCKPYKIPYALKERVETEIYHLVKEKILELVESSEWASTQTRWKNITHLWGF